MQLNGNQVDASFQRLSATQNKPANGNSNSNNRQSDRMLTGIAFTIWAALEGSYPGRWIRTAGDVLDADNRLASVARKWAAAAAGFDASDIEQALDWLATDRQGAEWLPSIGQFVNAAKSFRAERLSRDQLALPERTAEPVVTAAGQAIARQAIAQAWVALGQRAKAVEMLNKYGEVLEDV